MLQSVSVKCCCYSHLKEVKEIFFFFFLFFFSPSPVPLLHPHPAPGRGGFGSIGEKTHTFPSAAPTPWGPGGGVRGGGAGGKGGRRRRRPRRTSRLSGGGESRGGSSAAGCPPKSAPISACLREGNYYKTLCTFSRSKAKDAYCIRCQCILLLNRREDHLQPEAVGTTMKCRFSKLDQF